MVGLIAAAVMVASFFVPWIDVFGTQFAPSFLFDDRAPPLADYPWRIYVLVSSFAFAALAVILVVVRRPAGGVMAIAGGIPIAILLDPILRGYDQIKDLPVDIPTGADFSGVLEVIGQNVSLGVPMYLVSAVVLLSVGLVRMLRGA